MFLRQARVSAVLDRCGTALLLLLLGAVCWTTLSVAAAKPVWHDEIYTILIARLPTIQTIWAAARDGVDLAAPLHTLAAHVAFDLFGSGPIPARLPALAGFWTTLVVLFVMVRRRSNAAMGLAAALLPIQTAAYRYAYEARGYGLMIGFAAVALFAWTEASRGRRPLYVPLLAITLAAGVWSHYYAALMFAVIGAGEIVRQVVRRQLDLPMWMALGGAGVLVLPLLPLVRTASTHASGFWAHPADESVREAYAFLLQPLVELLSSVWGAAAGGAVVLAAAHAAWARSTRSPDVRPTTHGPSGLPAHEIAAYVALLLFPAGAVLLGRSVTGVFTPRYGLVGVLGFALAVPLVVRFAAQGARLPELLLCGALAVPFARTLPLTATYVQQIATNPVSARPLLASALASSGPVAAAGSLTFLQFWYYAPPELRSRLVYVADPTEALRYMGTDTFDRGYLGLSRWTAVSVQRYDTFVERYDQFKLYSAGSGWLLRKLQDEGADVEFVGTESGGQLYMVRTRHARP